MEHKFPDAADAIPAIPAAAPGQPLFCCFLVQRPADLQLPDRPLPEVVRGMTWLPRSELPSGDVCIRVQFSSLNYKDALAAEGHPGVVRQWPHVPGIDAAGIVEASHSDQWKPGDEVLVTGYELGAGHWGGWSQYIQVPAEWVVRKPAELSLRQAMSFGTAGFTAALCLRELQRHDVQPHKRPVVVTGASGGVGCLAVALLAKLGYPTIAVTGKEAAHDWLRRLGATQVWTREQLLALDRDRPMLSAQFGGAVDTVGGRALEVLIRSLDVNGCVAACGMVAGHELALTVYPFILRGARLSGITSALCPRPLRLEIWDRLAGEWNLAELDRLVTEIGMENVDDYVGRIRHGNLQGRVLISIPAGQ